MKPLVVLELEQRKARIRKITPRPFYQNFTLDTMQSGRCCCPGNCKTRSLGCQICPSTQHVSNVLESNRNGFIPFYLTFCIAIVSCNTMIVIPWCFLRTVVELIWRLHEVWRTVTIDCAERPRHLVTPARSWSCSKLLPGCSNITYNWDRIFMDWILYTCGHVAVAKPEFNGLQAI